MKRFLALSAVLVVLLPSLIGGCQFAGRVSRLSMYARECPDCRSDWPYENEYRSCPQCEVDTRVVAKRPMTPRQAKFRMYAIEFERMYQQRELERESRGEPSPEDIGRDEALRDRAEMRKLEGLLRG